MIHQRVTISFTENDCDLPADVNEEAWRDEVSHMLDTLGLVPDHDYTGLAVTVTRYDPSVAFGD